MTSKSLKLQRKDHKTLKRAEFKDEANELKIGYDRHNSISAKETVIRKVSYASLDYLSNCPRPKGVKIAKRQDQYISRDD